jgi:hypothetical protein
MSIAENKQDCVPGLVPADGTMLPIGESGDFGRSPFFRAAHRASHWLVLVTWGVGPEAQ